MTNTSKIPHHRYLSGFVATLSLGALLALGLIHLCFPFTGDQALFLLGGEGISHGETLYRDLWDLKQPGIFLFFFLGGKIFAYQEWGIHLFELCHWVLFSFYGIWLLRRINVLQSDLLVWGFPIFTCTLYYLLAQPDNLTQVESLVGFPFFVSLTLPLLYLQTDRNQIGIHFITGLFYGIVFYYKLVFLLMLGIFSLFYVFFLGINRRHTILNIILKTILPVSAGFFTVIGAGALYYYSKGTLPLVIETFFVTPNQIIAEVEAKSLRAFLGGTLEFLLLVAPCLIFALVGFVRYRRKQPVLVWGMAIWIAAGLLTIYLQKFSYWSYHYLLLLFPIGFLNLLGLDDIIYRARIKRFRPLILLVLLYIPFGIKFVNKSSVFLEHDGAFTTEGCKAYLSHYDQTYEAVRQEVGFLKSPASLTGDIYVCGNPLFYYLSGRKQQIAITGWSLEFFTRGIWDNIVRQLSAEPATYIFVDQGYHSKIRDQHPAFHTFLQNHYFSISESNYGRWYQLSSAADNSTLK